MEDIFFSIINYFQKQNSFKFRQQKAGKRNKLATRDRRGKEIVRERYRRNKKSRIFCDIFKICIVIVYPSVR